MTGSAAHGHTWGILSVRSNNFLAWHDSLEAATAEFEAWLAAEPDIDPTDFEIVEFDAKGMPV